MVDKIEHGLANPGIIEADIQAAIGIDGRLDEPLNVGGNTDIRPHEDRFATRFVDTTKGFVGVASPGDHNFSPLTGESDGRRLTDARPATRNKNHLAAKIQIPLRHYYLLYEKKS
jgi:hypothetical protein